MGQWNCRKYWQAFKKKYPQFEKHKKFKSDVGPQMDKFEGACELCLKKVAEVEKALDEMRKVGLSLQAALKGYKAVMDELEKNDPSCKRIWHDFMNGPTWCNNANFKVRNDLEELGKKSDSYKIDFQVQ